MLLLKQSTSATLKIGPFVDSGDGNTVEDGLTITQADVRLSVNGGDMAQKNDATSCTHDELGYYDCPVNTTDTGTLGRLQLFVHESGALPVFHEYMVIPANVYDSLVSGTDYLDAEVATLVAAVANKIADHVLLRTMANLEATSDGDSKTASSRSMMWVMANFVNKVSESGGNLIITEDDDSTQLYARAITTNAAADPITALDTA